MTNPNYHRLSARWRHGQSLMEAVIAVGIMATAIAAALTLVQSSIVASRESEASIVAGNLAREGVEVARAIRDSNWLAGDAWDQGLEATLEPLDYSAVAVFEPDGVGWSFDFAPDATTEDATRVWRHVTGVHVGLQVQAAAQPATAVATPYRRIVTLNPICDTDPRTVVPSGSSCAMGKIGARVTSRVEWNQSDRRRHLEMTEDLYDWR